MRKILLLIATLLLTIGLVACNANDDNDGTKGGNGEIPAGESGEDAINDQQPNHQLNSEEDEDINGIPTEDEDADEENNSSK